MPKRDLAPLEGARQIVSEAADAQGVNLRQLSLAIGKNATYIQQWVKYAAPATLPEEARLSIAKALGLDERLLRKNAVPTPKVSDGRTPVFRGLFDLPLYAAVEGGEGEMVVTTEAVDFIQRPDAVKHIDTAYAVIVTGQSMEPVHRPGEIVIVNPKLPPVPDRDAIFVSEVHGGDFKASVKRLVRSTPTHWVVKQFNPEKELQLRKTEWKAFKIVGKEYP